MKSAEKPFVRIFSTLGFILTGLIYDILIPPDFLECMYHQLTPLTHDLALFHQILLNRGAVFIFPSALLPWHVYTSVVNQLELHYSD